MTPVTERMRKSTAEMVPSHSEYRKLRLSLFTLAGNQCSSRFRTIESPLSRSPCGFQVHVNCCQVFLIAPISVQKQESRSKNQEEGLCLSLLASSSFLTPSNGSSGSPPGRNRRRAAHRPATLRACNKRAVWVPDPSSWSRRRSTWSRGKGSGTHAALPPTGC